MLRIGVPSKGGLHEPALRLLSDSGLTVTRPNSRNYTGEIVELPGSVVHFQRAEDITGQVEEGSVDAGIVGYDRFMENRRGEDAAVIFRQLGFGGCSVVLAVPEAWIDVSSVADLAEVSVDFRAVGKDLRVATKFPRLVEQFFLDRGVNYFSLVPAGGAHEAAPAMGYADMIADITESGATLKENNLKMVQGGTILESQACLIVNTAAMSSEPARVAMLRRLIDSVGERLSAKAGAADAPAGRR